MYRIYVCTMNKDWLHIEMKANKVAHLKIHGVIGGDWFDEGVTAEQVDRDLSEIEAIEANTIIVDLASLGGSVDHGLKIHNMLVENKANIEVNITGWTASMGTVIAMAADKGKLSMVNNSQFLIHESRAVIFGTQGSMKSAAKTLENVNTDIANIYSERTGLKQKDALALMSLNGGEGEFWGSKETKERGFVDKVYKPVRAIAAHITQEDLTKYKIKAKINNQKNKVMKFNIKEIAAYVLSVVGIGVAKLSDEDKTTENLENLVNEGVKIAVEALQPKIDEALAEKDAEITALTTERDALKATGTDPKAGDPALNGDDPKMSDAKTAMTAFQKNLPPHLVDAMAKKHKENSAE